jgi:dGTPase
MEDSSERQIGHEHSSACASRNRLQSPWSVLCEGIVAHEYDARHPANRTFFQQDRDRLLHSEAFRRLGYKTQVFVVHEGDFYRTRLTHTLEVSQVARGLAGALGANEDLCEAISYAHDLGHPPFGHRGEERLDALFAEILDHRLGLTRPSDGIAFEQNFQSYRIVSQLERRYPAFPGLNLSHPALHGILNHHTAFDHPAVPYPWAVANPKRAERMAGDFLTSPGCSAEGQIVNLADQVAWVTHDLEDALRVRFITVEELHDLKIPLLQVAWERAAQAGPGWDKDRILWGRLLVRNMIDILINDVIERSQERLKGFDRSSQVMALKDPVVNFSPVMAESVNRLREFLFSRVYTHPVVERMSAKASGIIERLFISLTDDLLERRSMAARLLPHVTRERLEEAGSDVGKYQVIVDFLAGMTDRFATEFYRVLFEPEEKGITSLY